MVYVGKTFQQPKGFGIHGKVFIWLKASLMLQFMSSKL